MERQQVWQAIDDHRLRLIALMETLSDEQWRQPSLCGGWTVRDVAGHLAWQQRAVSAETMIGFLRARGDMHRAIHDIACRHAQRPVDALIAQFRRTVGTGKPVPGVPGITYLETLIDNLVHGQDIAMPLGLELDMPLDAAAVAATRIWSTPSLFDAMSQLTALRFTATDVDWSAGDGPEIRGPIAAILLLLTGRPVAIQRLTGDGVPRALAGLPLRHG